MSTIQQENNRKYSLKKDSIHSYQNAVTMGTHSSSKPLMGLELNLSVHVIYIKIPITCKKIEEKKKRNHIFIHSQYNSLSTPSLENRRSNAFSNARYCCFNYFKYPPAISV